MDEQLKLPTQISPDGHEVWDWANRLSERVQAVDELKRMQAKLHNARATCGSCTSWMTRLCPREIHSNLSGRSQGPSSGAIKCDRFRMTPAAATQVEESEARIAVLRQQLQIKETKP